MSFSGQVHFPSLVLVTNNPKVRGPAAIWMPCSQVTIAKTGAGSYEIQSPHKALLASTYRAFMSLHILHKSAPAGVSIYDKYQSNRR